jgi:amino acid transporter
VWSLVMLAVVAILGYRHIELSAAVLGVALVLEILVVVVMDLAVVGKGGAEGLSLREFTPASLEGGPLAIALLFALTGFIGYEAAAVFRDEAKDPNRTIPRATYAAVLIIGIFYAISTWAIVMAWGPSGVREIAADSLASGGNLMLDTSEEYAGSATTEMMRVLLVTSLFACVLSFHNIVARYQFTLAHRGVLPAPLGRIHPRHHSPSLSSVVQTVTALVIVVIFAVADADPLIGVFGSMAGVATTGMVSMMVLTSVAVLVFFARRPELREGRVAQTTVAPAVATIGLLIAGYVVVDNFALVTGAGTGLNVLLMGVVAAAFVLGVLHPRHRKLESEAAPEAG